MPVVCAMNVRWPGVNSITSDMLHRQTVEAALSPAEQRSFHRVAYGLGSAVSIDHRTMLVDMGLVYVDDIGLLALTEAGWQRYERESAGRQPLIR
jgi:hypothetical protein